MTPKRRTATTLRQQNSHLAVLDSALSELEERRTAIIHRIGSFSSGSRQHEILQFPGALTVDTYTERVHAWSASPSHPRCPHYLEGARKIRKNQIGDFCARNPINLADGSDSL